MKDKSNFILYGVAIVIVIITIICVILHAEEKKKPYKEIGEGFSSYYNRIKESGSYLNEITNEVVNGTK